MPIAVASLWAATVSDAVDMKKTKKIAISGIFTALCVVFLLIGSLFQSLDLSTAALGSLVILIVFIELGSKWAWGVYAAASVLSLILLPSKTPAVVFAFMLGYYPIIKAPLNKIKPYFLSMLARIAFLNISMTALIFIATRLFHIEEDFIGFGVIIYLLANVTFIVFDFALEKASLAYLIRLKPILFRKR